jgi:putative ABC transport system permease protein
VTQLPLVLDPYRGVALGIVTIFMCAFSGLLAIRRVGSADPADVF